MRMHNPPHPGEILNGLWLQPMGVSVTQAAGALGVSRKTLSKIINGRAGISPEGGIHFAPVIFHDRVDGLAALVTMPRYVVGFICTACSTSR